MCYKKVISLKNVQKNLSLITSNFWNIFFNMLLKNKTQKKFNIIP
jgi:hypothetical protein